MRLKLLITILIPLTSITSACTCGGGGSKGEDASETATFTMVCLEPPRGEPPGGAQGDLAPHAHVQWMIGEQVLGAQADANGLYSLCTTLNQNQNTTAEFQMQSPLPIGNELWTKPVTMNFLTHSSSKLQIIHAPLVGTQIMEDNSDGQNLETTLPQLAMDRLVWDQATQQLIYDGALSPNKGKEAGWNFINGTIFSTPDFSTAEGLVTINAFELNFDYETIAGDLLEELFVLKSLNKATLKDGLSDLGEDILDAIEDELLDQFPDLKDDPEFYGLLEPAGGAYSNTRIFVADYETTKEKFDGTDNFCTEAKINRVSNTTYSELEQGFIDAVDEAGGVDGGILPGAFLSGSMDQAEHYNTDVNNVGLNAGGKGTLHYQNLPLIDCTQVANREVSILIIEGDENIYNDIVACWERVSLPCTAAQTSELTNQEFLAARKVQDLIITDVEKTPYTAKIVLGRQ